jgi:WD40 repeat protein
MAATGDGKSVDGRFLAVGEGSPSGGSGRSFILVFDLERKKLHRRLGFHQKGIQSLAFSYDGCYLVSVGVAAENTLAVWDLASGLVLKHA